MPQAQVRRQRNMGPRVREDDVLQAHDARDARGRSIAIDACEFRRGNPAADGNGFAA